MPAALACLATGFPVPIISWRKDCEEENINMITLTSSSGVIQTDEYIRRGSILHLLMMYTNFTVNQVLQLGELGVVGLLSFNQTLRRDTANYTCTASNHFVPTNRTLTTKSNIVQMIILGE